MTFDLFTISVCAFIASIPILIGVVIYAQIQKNRIYAKYGKPQIPDEIKDIKDKFGNEVMEIDLNAYSIREKIKDHVLYEKKMQDENGEWNLAIEFNGKNEMTGFEYRYVSKRSQWVSFGGGKIKK